MASRGRNSARQHLAPLPEPAPAPAPPASGRLSENQLAHARLIYQIDVVPRTPRPGELVGIARLAHAIIPRESAPLAPDIEAACAAIVAGALARK